MKYIVIGISDAPQPFFPPEVLDIIRRGSVFSGGRRHHERVAHLLPEGAQWIDITVPLSKVFEQYERLETATAEVIVFASGDPLFFGFANTLKRWCSSRCEVRGARCEDTIVVYPAPNSLQMLAHRLVMPYHDMRIVSLTGRPWHEFDRALIERSAKIGVLTDREHTPAAIAQRMLQYGYIPYYIYIGEHLGNPERERIHKLSLEEAAHGSFEMPNCVILSRYEVRGTLGENSFVEGEDSNLAPRTSHLAPRYYGIPDNQFELLDGREKMITKAPIRLLTLAALELQNRQSMWDIGFCTGSISIEARLMFPHLRVTAFEIRPEGQRLMDINSRRFGAPGITTCIGDFLALPCDELDKPDAIFIGGHGGHLADIIRKANDYLLPGGVMVYNCVSPSSVSDRRIRSDSQEIFCRKAAELGLIVEQPLHVAINDYHPIDILKARKP